MSDGIGRKKRRIMKADNLKELRELRIQEKAIKARIDEISGKATDEAVAILAAKGLEKGEFEVEGVGKFQLQLTEVIDFSDHHRYKGEEAVLWRKKKQAQDLSKNYTKALTEEMSGLIDSFRKTHPNWQPDEVKKVVKCL